MSDNLCRELEPFIDAPAAAPEPEPLQDAAARRYAKHHASCYTLLEEIREALGDLPAPDCGIPINWGHAGSLAEAVTRLQNVKAWVEGIR